MRATGLDQDDGRKHKALTQAHRDPPARGQLVQEVRGGDPHLEDRLVRNPKKVADKPVISVDETKLSGGPKTESVSDAEDININNGQEDGEDDDNQDDLPQDQENDDSSSDSAPGDEVEEADPTPANNKPETAKPEPNIKMATGAVIENLSNRKLFGILSTLLLVQILFFALGAVFSPDPSSSMEFLMTKCKDKNHGTTPEWFFIRPSNHCDKIDTLEGYESSSDDAKDIVFVAQMPHARSGIALEYSAWFQFLIGYLEVDMEWRQGHNLQEKVLVEMDIRMASRTKQEEPTKWTEYISTTVQRTLECHIDAAKKINGFLYNCSTWICSINRTLCNINNQAPNCAMGPITDLRLIAVHQNGGLLQFGYG
uniref:Wntless GOLD domain-containing protein n=1 Tax=Ditylenchus dipsaci TaxID=166011 RepID=A0A915D117_9BILA